MRPHICDLLNVVVICLYNMSSQMVPPWIARLSVYVIICTLLPRFSCSSLLITMLNSVASLWCAICQMVDFRLLSLKLYISGSVHNAVNQPHQELASDV